MTLKKASPAFLIFALAILIGVSHITTIQSSAKGSQKPTPKPTVSPTATPTPSPIPTPVTSGPGSIDTTFGQNGITLFQPAVAGGGTPVHRRSVIQSDGKVVTLLQNNAGGVQNLLSRLNLDGTLDDTFGTGGYVYMSWAGGSGLAYELTKQVIDGEERFVAAGWTPCGNNKNCIRVERYTNAGALDTSFGTDGVTNMSGVNYPTAMAVQPADQKILLVNGAGVVVRFTADGLPDSTFGTSGKSSAVGFGMNGVAVSSTGRIVVCGSYQNDFALARLNSNGSLDDGGQLDTTPGDYFGIGGRSLTDFGGYSDTANSVLIGPNDAIFAAGQAQIGGSATANSDAVLVKTMANGQPDSNFGTGGKTHLDIGGQRDVFYTLTLENDGKIVAAGEGHYAGITVTDLLTAQFNADGTIDSSFGIGGWVMTDGYGLSDLARSVMMQDDPYCEGCQKIVVTGAFATSATTWQTVAIRYNKQY